MKKGIGVIFIITAIACFFVPASFAANLLENPGFERGDFPPDSWDDWSGSESGDPNDGVAGFTASKEYAHYGNKGVGKILYGTGDRWGGFSQTFDVNGGKAFRASAWVMNNKNDVALGKGAKAYVEVKFLDGDENELRKAKSRSASRPTRWERLSVRGVIPGKAEKAVFSLVLAGPKGSRGKVFFDDAVFDVIE